jgi:biopolymer transport protein ExbD
MAAPVQSGEDGGASHAALTYRGLRARRTSTALGEINVTPLVDVVLVLLLVFMVTAPMMSRGIDVSLPVADQPQIEHQERVTVSVTAEGRVYVGDDAVNLVLLEDHLKQMIEGRGLKVVYLKADERLRYGKVIEVMDKIKRSGVELVGLAYQLPDEKERK